MRKSRAAVRLQAREWIDVLVVCGNFWMPFEFESLLFGLASPRWWLEIGVGRRLLIGIIYI